MPRSDLLDVLEDDDEAAGVSKRGSRLRRTEHGDEGGPRKAEGTAAVEEEDEEDEDEVGPNMDATWAEEVPEQAAVEVVVVVLWQVGVEGRA